MTSEWQLNVRLSHADDGYSVLHWGNEKKHNFVRKSTSIIINLNWTIDEHIKDKTNKKATILNSILWWNCGILIKISHFWKYPTVNKWELVDARACHPKVRKRPCAYFESNQCIKTMQYLDEILFNIWNILISHRIASLLSERHFYISRNLNNQQ